LDFIGQISRSLVSVIGKTFLNAEKATETREKLVAEVSNLFGTKRELALAA